MPADSPIIHRSLFSLSWPIFIDLLLHFSTLLINTYMVSHVSRSYLAAMGVGNQVFNLCITVFSFISVGCSVVIAQYLGAGNRLLAAQVIHVSIAFNVFLGAFCAGIVIVFGESILSLMNVPPDLMPQGFAYLHILGICLFPEAVSLILAACLRVHGYAKTTMYTTLIVNVISILGNMIALYGFAGIPPSGLTGVAWSTVFGRFVAILLLAFLLSYGLKIKFERRLFFRWGDGVLKKILHIGLPAAGENILWTGQYMVVLAVIGLMGETALAAQTVYFQLSLFVMSLGIAISLGNEIIVGHYVGAKRFDDAYRRTFKSLRLGLYCTFVTVVAFWLLKDQILAFVTEDEQLKRLLIPLFTLSVFLELGRTFNIVMVNALRASGDARFPLYSGLVFMWGVSVPLAYLFGIKLQFGLIGAWMAFFCDEWMRGLVNAWRWKSRRWETKRLAI